MTATEEYTIKPRTTYPLRRVTMVWLAARTLLKNKKAPPGEPWQGEKGGSALGPINSRKG